MTIDYNHELEPKTNGSTPDFDVLLAPENLPSDFKTTWGLKVEIGTDDQDHITVDLADSSHEYKNGPIMDIAIVLRRMYVAAEYGQDICLEDFNDSRLPVKLLESNVKLLFERLKEAEKGQFVYQRTTLTDDRKSKTWYGMQP